MALLGCSASSDRAEEISSVALYLEKPAFGVKLYEQYKIDGGLLYCECGTIAELREIEDAGYSSAEVSQEFLQSLQTILEIAANEWVPSDNGKSLVNRGEVSVNVLGDREVAINTSLSHVSSPNGYQYRVLRDFVQQIRSMGPEALCEHQSLL